MVVIQRQGQFLIKVASVVILVLDSVMLLVRNDIADEFYSRILLLLVLLSLRFYDSSHELNVLRLENNFKGGVAASLELLDILPVSDCLYDEGVGSRRLLEEELTIIVGETSCSRVLDVYGDVLQRFLGVEVNDGSSDSNVLGVHCRQ